MNDKREQDINWLMEFGGKSRDEAERIVRQREREALGEPRERLELVKSKG